MSAALRELSHVELEEKLAESKEELFNLRFQLATNQLDNTSRLSAVKKQIARILTVMREQEIEAWRAQQATEGEA
jgi:large subunit ribosomal protein L29